MSLTGIEGLVRLRWLDLGNTRIIDIQPLAKLRQLRSLDLSRSNVIDLGALSRLSYLEDLNLGGTTAVILSPLYRLKRLRRLLIGGDANAKQLKVLRKHVPDLSVRIVRSDFDPAGPKGR